ncbi:MAG TPA: PilZ domain-containing protein [Sphingobium sp.]
MRNRAKRDSLFLLAEVVRETGEAMGSAKIRNLSATGLMADSETAFAEGDRLVFDLRHIGPVAGHVSWVKDNRIGVHFDREIDPQAVRKPVGTDPGKGIPLYVRYLGVKTPPPKR